MSTPQVFTHNGWFFLCPIKIANADSECPELAARWLFLEPWFSVNQWWQHATIMLLSAMNPDYEPRFMISITGRRR